MKTHKKTIAIACCACIAAVAIAASTPSLRVSLTEAQADEAKFLRACTGETNIPVSQWLANHPEMVAGIVWSDGAQQLLKQRRIRVIQYIANQATDDQLNAVERALGLPPAISVGSGEN